MFKSVDFYLGIFLILSGFFISLLNLTSVLRAKNKFSHILMSENIFLICIGVAFLIRGVYSLDPHSMSMEEFEERMLMKPHDQTLNCGFPSLFLSYGPLILSMVNSFLSLVVDNYMHYQMLKDERIKDNEDVVQNFSDNMQSERKFKWNSVVDFLKRNSSYITIFFQWLIPIVLSIFLYPMNVQELSMSEMRNFHDHCINILDLTEKNCSLNSNVELHKYISSPINYLETLEQDSNDNKTAEVNFVLNNVFKILSNYSNNTEFSYTQMSKSARTPKLDHNCMKVCVTDNKSILLYMFILAFISIFVPITISIGILTKIHTMTVKNVNVKSYVTKEVLYNALFWSPVMFDTFLSLILCSYSMHSTRMSLFNVIANVYQVVKNFMNTKHFKGNMIVPV